MAGPAKGNPITVGDLKLLWLVTDAVREQWLAHRRRLCSVATGAAVTYGSRTDSYLTGGFLGEIQELSLD